MFTKQLNSKESVWKSYDVITENIFSEIIFEKRDSEIRKIINENKVDFIGLYVSDLSKDNKYTLADVIELLARKIGNNAFISNNYLSLNVTYISTHTKFMLVKALQVLEKKYDCEISLHAIVDSHISNGDDRYTCEEITNLTHTDLV
jgi:hypothetical protein